MRFMIVLELISVFITRLPKFYSITQAPNWGAIQMALPRRISRSGTKYLANAFKKISLTNAG